MISRSFADVVLSLRFGHVRTRWDETMQKTEKTLKTVGLDGENLNEFQIQITVEPDLAILIEAKDPTQLLILATRIVTTLKDQGLDPKVRILP
jgi:hypothetical protein